MKSKSVSTNQSRRSLFVSSFILIMLIVGLCEAGVMFFLEYLSGLGIVFQPKAEALLDTTLLSITSSPLLWFFALRPLALKIEYERAQSEKHAQLSKELHSALDVHALISITDTEGKIIHANPQFCEVTGYSEQELIGKDHRKLNSGEHDKNFIGNLWKTIKKGQVWQGEICNRSKNGQLFWVDTTIVPLLDQNGSPRQYIAIRRDITIQKITEIKLLALRRALEASSEMIFVTDADGYINYVNPALCLLSGCTEKELLGKKPNIFDSPDSDPTTLADRQSALEAGEPWFGRILNYRRVEGSPPVSVGSMDLRSYWAEVSITPIKDEHKKLNGFVQIQRDISNQIAKEVAQQMEIEDTAIRLAISNGLQSIQPLDLRFTEVLNNLFTLQSCQQLKIGFVFLTTKQGDDFELFVTQGSADDGFDFKAVCASLKADSEQGVSTKVVDVTEISPGNQPENRQPHGHYQVPLAFGKEILGVMFILTDPQPIKVEARISMLNQVGEMMALAIVREQVNEMLEKSRDAALQAAAIKSEFLANMSHEIRTPMNGVLGMLDLLKDTELSREQWDLVETAANSAEALLDIINDILDFSKLEAGKVELEIIEFNLPALIEEVCSLMAARVHAKDLELNCFIPVDMPKRWHGDPTRIRQVLINLVGNAVKFTEQGEISVKILQIKTDNGESAIRIEINDTGVGIPVEAQAHLFQPFAQADTSTARRFGGTGLGLSISSDLIKLMGGKIGLESKLGQGALFWLNLPLMPASNEVLPLISDLAGLRVLIVDDNATNRQILEHYLKHWGFIVEESDNAMDGLKKLEAAAKSNAAFNLLISDLHMPEMDGYALMRAINKNPSIADTPRILLSSGGLCTEEERKLLNISQSLLKPARQAQLFDAILNTIQSATIAPIPSVRKNPLLTSYQGKHVLVVEDHKVNQKVILSLLAKFGLTPSLAENGQKALEAIAVQRYDLVLMDCQMPVMDGYEATRLLREKEKASNTLHTPVIALTAHAGDGQYEKCISAGMDDYISKPIERSKLAEVLSQWLDGSSGEIADDHAIKIIDGKSDTGWDELGALEKLDNDEELLAELIELFIAEMPTQVSELKDAQAQGDLPLLADSAHAIKGMAGHFCATAIVSLAAELEDAARLSKAVDFKVLSDSLADQVTNLINLLQHK